MEVTYSDFRHRRTVRVTWTVPRVPGGTVTDISRPVSRTVHRDSTSSGYSSLCVLRCNGRRTRGPPGQGRWVPTSCLRQTNLYTEVDPTPPRINVTGPLNRSKRPRVYSTINLISESARCFSGVLYQLIYSLKLRISFRVSTHRSDHPSSRGTPSIPWAQGREDN